MSKWENNLPLRIQSKPVQQWVLVDPEQAIPESTDELPWWKALCQEYQALYVAHPENPSRRMVHVFVSEAPGFKFKSVTVATVVTGIQCPSGQLHMVNADDPSAIVSEEPIAVPAGSYALKASAVHWAEHSIDEYIEHELGEEDGKIYRDVEDSAGCSCMFSGCMVPMLMVIYAGIAMLMERPRAIVEALVVGTVAALFTYVRHLLKTRKPAAKRVMAKADQIRNGMPVVVIELTPCDAVDKQWASPELEIPHYNDELIGELTMFAGKAIRNYVKGTELVDAPQCAYQIRHPTWDGDIVESLDAFYQEADVKSVDALVIGRWQPDASSKKIVASLAAHGVELQGLRHLMIGNMTSEECELSWIRQASMKPLWMAFPDLETLHIRGGSDLALGDLGQHPLKTLIIESGGLPKQVLRDLAAASWPELEHLELWLGEENYGFDGSIDDIVPLFSGDRFPKLRYLGLRNSEIADQIARALTDTPLLERIAVLDLSLGTLGNKGARALASCDAIKNLERLDIHHHFCEDEVIDALQRAVGDVSLDVRLPQEPDDGEYRYIAIGE